MRTAGFEGQIAPSQDNSIQWLGQVIANEDRYSEAAVKFWWPSLMGAPVLEAPAASEDKDFATNLAAFETQNSFIKELGKKFAKGIEGGAAYNGKDLLTSMVLSEWFRADAVENVDVRDRLVSELGTRRLLTPEELEKKSRSLLGWTWGKSNWQVCDELNRCSNELDGEFSHLGNTYNLYYGGTDSDGITERSPALTALMVNVAEKQALDMTCPAVMVDFDREDSTRLLFNGIDANTTPATEIQREFNVDATSPRAAGAYSFKGNTAPGDKKVILSFTNDFNTDMLAEKVTQRRDRNLHLVELTITDGTGNTVLFLRFKDINSKTGVTHDCNGPGESGFRMWSNCAVSIPFSPELDSNYTFTVLAYGDQAGADLPKLVVELRDDNPQAGGSVGARAIKAVIVNLHNRLLGQSLNITDPEINMTYQVMVDAWQARKTWIAETNNNNVAQYPNSLCNYYLAEHTEEGGISSRTYDPSGMKNSWQVVLAYLMTDFNYLHE
jgi:hypothetical protein